MKIGSKIKLKDNSIATVKYIGNVEGKEGEWVGLELDNPAGKHNGTVEGVKYFECKDKYGVLVNEKKLKRDLHKSKYNTDEYDEMTDEYNKNKTDEYNKNKTDEYNKNKTDEYNKNKTDEYNKNKTDEYNMNKTDEYNKNKTDEYNKNKTDEYNKNKSNENVLDYEYDNNVKKIVKDSLHKSTIRKLKRELESLKISKKKEIEDLQKENEIIKKDNENIKKDLHNKNIKYSNLLSKFEEFEIVAKNIIEDISCKIKNIKRQDIEDEEYSRLCKYFKDIILCSIEGNNEGVETGLEGFYKICKKNKV